MEGYLHLLGELRSKNIWRKELLQGARMSGAPILSQGIARDLQTSFLSRN